MLHLTDPQNDCISVDRAHNDWGFFCDLFKNWWRQQPAFGANPQQREENLRRGGYTIVTSLDPKLQAIAMNEVTSKEPMGSSYALGMVAVQPGTGIQAAAVNRVYSLDQTRNGRPTSYAAAQAGAVSSYPNTVTPLLGGGDVAGYQAGSTFKIFTMLAALDMGLPLNTKINSPMVVQTQYPADGPGSCGGRWCPHNASAAMTGVHAMWDGFGMSVNTYFVQLEQLVGAERAVRMAERLGLHWRTDVDKPCQPRENGWGAFTLGVADTTPLEMANAYATIAADGVYCQPTPIMSILDSQGQPVAAGNPQCNQAVRVEAARAAVDATRCVTGYKAAAGSCGAWSTASGVAAAVGRPVGGKTGTTDDTRAPGSSPRHWRQQLHRRSRQPVPLRRRRELAKPINRLGLLRRGRRRPGPELYSADEARDRQRRSQVTVDRQRRSQVTVDRQRRSQVTVDHRASEPGDWSSLPGVYRFLLSPRWIGLGLLMSLAAATMVGLGLWQLSRYHYRSDINARIDAATTHSPLPITPTLVAPAGGRVGAAPDPAATWCRHAGHYDQSTRSGPDRTPTHRWLRGHHAAGVPGRQRGAGRPGLDPGSGRWGNRGTDGSASTDW